jgi:hypothetical protein
VRLLPFLLAICAGIVCIGTHAEARNYPWCASYSAGDTGGGMNCGFTTFQQCLDTVRRMDITHLPCAISTFDLMRLPYVDRWCGCIDREQTIGQRG